MSMVTDTIEERIERLEKEIKEMQAEIAPVNHVNRVLDDIRALIANLGIEIDELRDEMRRRCKDVID